MKLAQINVIALIVSFSAIASAQDDYMARYQAQTQTTRKLLQECTAQFKGDPRTIRFENEFIVGDSTQNSYKLLGSNQKINEEQRLFLLEALPLVTSCRNVRLDGEVGLHIRPITVELYRRTDLIFGKLLRREITIGEANSERTQVLADATAAAATAFKNLQEQQRQANNSNSSSSSSLLPLLLQQQMLKDSSSAADTRNQQLIDALKTKPSQTDCTRDGWGNVRCTTR